jgi:hypothetical protein
MKINTSFLHLLRQLYSSSTERRLAAESITVLVRSRLRLLWFTSPLLGRIGHGGSEKLLLWGMLARHLAGKGAPLSTSECQSLAEALSRTASYNHFKQRSVYRLSTPYSRSKNYSELLQQWHRDPPRRVFLFHHYDQRALLPRSWIKVLKAINAAGWSVVVSTTSLAEHCREELFQAGIQVAWRDNLGLCLGAYRDLILLLLSSPRVSARLASLVLCNDSTLPLKGGQELIGYLQAWAEASEQTDQGPVLSGFTDSAERERYHLQSYVLHANRSLLQRTSWLNFWTQLEPWGSKDDVIDAGEIGLSQAMLKAGVELRPVFSLVAGLFDDVAMADEVQRYSFVKPHQINQTLFAWQALLERGFPLVKKHVLFDLLENHGQPMALSLLKRWISEADRVTFLHDLQELFVSRYYR